MKHIFTYDELSEKRQLELPFDGKHPLHDKPAHVHVLDALKELHVHGMSESNYKSVGTTESEIKKHMPGAVKRLLDDSNETSGVGDWYFEFFSGLNVDFDDPEELKSLFKSDYLSDMLDDVNADLYSISTYTKDSEPDDMFTDEYKELWEDFVKDHAEYLTTDAVDAINESFSENGLVEVWRSVVYSKKIDQTGEGFDDIYSAIVDGFGGVGIFWSWDEDAAEAHWGYSNDPGKKELVLHGMLRTQDIDWVETLYLNMYGLRDEKEVRTAQKARVMLLGMYSPEDKKYVEFETPFIVPV
jgi:hypothetical protein